ncbi:hypothetical protein BDV23DRAFT_170164 [Aspergillus alliaceus]|uniref:FAD-binding PCMH-type domain-containing protein n=1 Tax=Petromyces alliaceus TaxID=209559 RepID=A0A5N7CJ30_PETAA|nr:hypothetical protein BDV23DRAFT_170164 [Aspergillus alliaceus]
MAGFYSVFITALPGCLPAIAIANPGSNPTSPECIQACSLLRDTFPPNTYFPGNPNIKVWDAKQETLSACWIRPSSPANVSATLNTITNISCRFTLKGGAHARDPDDSVSASGNTIDMQKMKAIEPSPDRKTVKLGAGHALLSIYHGLEKYNLTTLGGRVADVGLGGFVLSRGVSHLSPRYGLAVDNVLEYELVLPNSTVAIVNQATQPDLYFALRGGMNNFGLTYTADKRDVIVKGAFWLTTDWKNDTAMAFYYSFGYDQRIDDFSLAVSQEYSLPVLTPAPFKDLNQIPYESSTVRIDWNSRLSVEGATATPPGGRNLFATITYYPSDDLERQLQDIMAEEIQSIKKSPGFYLNLVIQPPGGSATVVLLTVLWENAQDDAQMNAFARKWVERSTAATKNAGQHRPWLYINYASPDQDPFLGYGKANLQRLRDIHREGYFKLQ